MKYITFFLVSLICLFANISIGQDIQGSISADKSKVYIIGDVSLSKTAFLTIESKNLTTDMTLTLEGDGATSVFNVIKANGWSNRIGGRLTIRYAPINEGIDNATLVIHSGSTTLSIPIVGAVSKVTAEPGSWDAGYVVLNADPDKPEAELKDVSLTISNVPEALELRISNNANAEAYSIIGNKNIAQGIASSIFSVQFNPSAVKLFNYINIDVVGVDSEWKYEIFSLKGVCVDSAEEINVNGIKLLKPYKNTNGVLNLLLKKSSSMPMKYMADYGNDGVIIQSNEAGVLIKDPNKYLFGNSLKGSLVDSDVKLTYDPVVECFILKEAVTLVANADKVGPFKSFKSVTEINADAEYMYVLLNNFKFDGINKKAIDANGGEMKINNSIAPLAASADNVDIYGIYLPAEEDNVVGEVMIVNADDFKTSIRVDSNMPTTLTAGEATEFEITLNYGNDYTVPTTGNKLYVMGDAKTTFLLEYKDKVGVWKKLSFNNNNLATLIIPPFDANNKMYFKVTPIAIKESVSIDFNYEITVGNNLFKKAIVVSSIHKEYSTSGNIAVVNVDANELDFETVNIGETKSIIFKVTAEHLESDLTIGFKTAQGTKVVYTVEPLTIPKNAIFPFDVKVSFKPIDEVVKNNYVVISGGGLFVDKEIKITGIGYNTSKPRIATNIATLKFGEVYIGETKSMEFAVISSNIGVEQTIFMTNTSDDSYTFTPSVIPVGATETIVIVTVTPTSENTVNNGVKIGDGTYATVVMVTFTAKGVVKPEINVDKERVDFKIKTGEMSTPAALTVSAVKLVENMVINIEGIDANKFTYTTSGGWSEIDGGTINVVYNSAVSGTHSATLKITAGNIIKTVTLAGTAGDPTLTATPTNMTFSSKINVETAVQKVNVVGADLLSDINVTIEGTHAAMFIQATTDTWSATTGGNIDVKYKPTVAGSHTATLKIAAGDLVKLVTLAGVATNPTITVNPTSLMFDSHLNTETEAKSIMVNAIDITTDMVITLEGTDAGMFNKVTATDWNSKTGGKIEVKYKPTAVGEHSATLKIVSGAIVVEVALTATAIDPNITIDVTKLEFISTVNVETSAKKVVIKGTDLNSDIRITVDGENWDAFSWSKNSDWDVRKGGSIDIKYKPLAAGNHTAKLKIVSGSLSKELELLGSATIPTNPMLEVDKQTLTFEAKINIPVEAQIIKVSGIDLAADIEVNIDNEYFTVTKHSNWNGRTGGDLEVKYNNSVVGTHEADLTLSAGDKTVTVKLNGKTTPGVGVIALEENVEIYSSNRNIIINTSITEAIDIQIINMLGIIVTEVKGVIGYTSISVESGIYIAKVISDGKYITRKIIIK